MLLGEIFHKFLKSSLVFSLLSILSRYFFLKIGLADAVFASSENEFFRRSLLVIFARCESIILADSLTIFGGILSGPVAFFAFSSFITLFYLL